MPLALSRTGVVFKKCYINNAGDFDRLARNVYKVLELVDFESCLVGEQDTFADCLYLVDPGVSRVSCLEHRAIRAIDALPCTSCTRHGARTNRAVRRRHRRHRRCLPRPAWRGCRLQTV